MVINKTTARPSNDVAELSGNVVHFVKDLISIPLAHIINEASLSGKILKISKCMHIYKNNGPPDSMNGYIKHNAYKASYRKYLMGYSTLD